MSIGKTGKIDFAGKICAIVMEGIFVIKIILLKIQNTGIFKEGAMLLIKTAPMPSYIAKVIKEKVWLDTLLETGWNLSEVETEFGKEWLDK